MLSFFFRRFLNHILSKRSNSLLNINRNVCLNLLSKLVFRALELEDCVTESLARIFRISFLYSLVNILCIKLLLLYILIIFYSSPVV